MEDCFVDMVVLIALRLLYYGPMLYFEIWAFLLFNILKMVGL